MPVGSESGALRRLRGIRTGKIVAITGACSFIGTNLVGVLEDDDTVARIVVLDIEAPKTAGRKTSSYHVDLTQPSASARVAEILRAERVEVLIHLAFLASPTPAEGWAHELESVGTMHLLLAARQAGVRRVIARSHTELYGPHPSNPNFLVEGTPLRGIGGARFFADKIDAERQVQQFAAERGTSVTILRLAPIMGPTVRTVWTNWLSHRLVPTLLGYDPLLQFVHEADAIAAFKTTLDLEVPGTFNIVGRGVLPLSSVVRLAGRFALPMPGPLLRRAASVSWLMGVGIAPSSFIHFLRFLCVADGSLAARELGLEPVYSVKEAVLDFGEALRLREAKLIREGDG